MVRVRSVELTSWAKIYGILHMTIGVLVGLGKQEFGMSQAARPIVATNSFDPMDVAFDNGVSRSVSFHPPVSAVADEWPTLSKDGAKFEPHSI
jgi:hypothetical protein